MMDCTWIQKYFVPLFQPGEVWVSNCNLCSCNNQTRTEECYPKPPEPVPLCGPNEVLVNTSCCGDQMCGKNSLFTVFYLFRFK